MAASPIDQRLSAAESSPPGYIIPSGTASFKALLRGNVSAFADWRRLPMTRKALAALQDMAVHLPPGLDTEDRLVQYGMTQGLMFAMQLLADPSAIWPGVFGKDVATVHDLPSVMDFDTSIDDVLDAR